MKKCSGHTAVELALYEECQIMLNKPDKVVIIAGTNDLSYAYQAGTFCPDEIAENILNAGRVGLHHSIPVIISGLFVRKNQQMNKCTQDVNKILKQRCEEEGFTYMDQGKIKEKHISPDGLHLGNEGSRILMSTILKTLNPSTTLSTQQNKPVINQNSSLRYQVNNIETEEVSTEEEEESEVEDEILNIRPGLRSYSNTVEEGEKAMIFSTSITKGIDVRRFNKAFDRGTADFERFPGKKAHHLKNYLKTHLEEKRPNCVILQGGGNDLPSSTPVADIADDLLEAAGTCKRFGVKKICIGGVPARPGLQKRCYELNRILERRCKARNYVFINNKHVLLAHLYDNVHLDDHGSAILANNYLDVLNTPIVRR